MKFIRLFLEQVVVALYVLMVIGVLLQVFVRYLPIPISDFAEMSKFAQIWMIALASALAMKNRMHVGVDLLLDALPHKLKSILYALIGFACILFLWLTVYNSIDLVRIGFAQRSPSMQIPMYIPYLAIPLGFSYLLVETFILYVSLCFKNWKEHAN